VKKDVAVIMMLLAFGTVLCHAQTIMVRVTNRAAFARESETVSLLWNELNKKLPSLDRNSVTVLDKRRKDNLAVQTTERELLFQADFKAKETKTFIVTNGPANRPQERSLVDGRFVLPREDYAWENDRIAFRMYGPAMAKDVKNGIDVWTKRVRHLIVEKWYKESEGSPPGKDTYHMDRGKGQTSSVLARVSERGAPPSGGMAESSSQGSFRHTRPSRMVRCAFPSSFPTTASTSRAPCTRRSCALRSMPART